MVYTLLQNYRQATRVAPKKLIFYRDGVSEGQFKEVLQYEVSYGLNHSALLLLLLLMILILLCLPVECTGGSDQSGL